MYLTVIHTFPMRKTIDNDLVAARRARLQHWIETHHAGRQSEFVKRAKVNQGELSALLKDKSFGEKRAAAIEKLAGMPDGYLVRPLDEPRPAELRRLFTAGSTEPAGVDGTLMRHEGHIFNLQLVLNAVLAALARSTPSVAAELHQALLDLPGHTHGYLADAVQTVHEARETTVMEQLSALRLAVSSTGGKT
jgi:hypothetical protein